MASSDAPVAVVGAGRLLGRAVANRLVQEGVPQARIRLLDARTGAGRLEDLNGTAVLIGEADPDLLARADRVFLCLPPEEAQPLLEVRRARGSLWLDLSGISGRRPRIPLVNLLANPGALPSRRSGLVALPGAGAHLLSTLLAPLVARGGCRRAQALLFYPASELGQEGLDELYQQSVGLLNFTQVPKQVFGRQLAFNLWPLSDAPEMAERVCRETMRILRLPAGRLTVAGFQAPVFHGHAVAVHLEAPGSGDAGAMIEALEEAGGLTLRGPGKPATPVGLAGESGVTVQRPWSDGTGRNGWWLWAVADDLAAGSACNAVRVAAARREG